MSATVSGTDLAVLCGGLLLGVGIVFEILYQSAGKKSSRVFTACNAWFIFSGVVHCWVEYTMVFHRSGSLLQHVIDYYGTADARYGNLDGQLESGTAAMEAITAVVVGPLCLLVALAAVHDLAWRYPLQLVVCTMQLYGMVWLVAQPVFSAGGWKQHYTADEALFWGAVVGGNLPWLLVVPIMWWDAWSTIEKRMN